MGTSQDWIDRADACVAKNYGRYPLVAESGQGCWLTDVDGNRYLDFVAGIAVNNLGHCHPQVVKAIQDQAATMLHCSNLYHIPTQIRLAELLCEHSFGDQVFFCNSGAEANEAAIKMARKYSYEKYGSERYEVITATASFHGRTLGTMSATGQEKIQKGFTPLMPGFKYAPYGDFEALIETLSEKTCAIMLEPIQGEGGVNVPPAGYLQAIRQLCDDKDIVLIFDEIQVGMGRTGSLFAYQSEGVAPDAMSLAKALAGGPPIGALVARKPFIDVLGPGSHGSTFGGNPLVTAAGVASMEVLLNGATLPHAVAMGDYLRGELEKLKEKYAFIVDVRGRGLILGMEMTIEGGDIVTAAMAQGLLINCTMGKILRFVPPLIVTQEEIDRMIEILDGILAQQ